MRVLLCRARPDSERTAERLSARGFEAVIAPVISIEPLPFELPSASPCAVLATSTHAFDALTEQQASRLLAIPVYTVGPETAEAARRVGFTETRIGARNGEALTSLLALTLPRPAILLYLAGRIRKPEVEEQLRRAGYQVVIAESYDAAEAEPWSSSPCLELRSGRVGACLHFSARSADLAFRFAQKAGLESHFDRLHHLCLSDDVATTLARHDIQKLAVADAPRESSLLDMLEHVALSRGR